MSSRMAIITFLDESGNYPSQGLPGAPVYPGQGLPISPGHPGNALPPPGSIATLPVFPFDPTIPSNELPDVPTGPESPIRPGKRFIVKWLACHGLILVPDNTLPETAEPR